MTDVKRKLPELPAGAAETIIQAAANISGKQPGELDLDAAMEILQGDHPDPAINALINETAEKAAGQMLGDLTDEQAAELTQAAQDGALQEALEAAAQELAKDPGKIITFTLPEYDPALDPKSPEFDPEKWQAYTLEASAKLRQAVANVNAQITASVQPAAQAFAEISERIQETLSAQNNRIADAISSAFASIPTAQISETLEQLLATPAFELIRELEELEPLIRSELQKDEYNGLTFEDLLDSSPGELLEQAHDENSTLAKLLKAARAAANNAPRTTVKRAENVEYPLDKPNSKIWKLLDKDTRGQVTFEMATDADKRKGVTLPTYYSIDFEDLGNEVQITKRLLPFDKRVYIAVSALFNAGNNVITLSQIYYAMGYTGRPGANNLTKINNAITKMTGARIFFDNEQEANKYKYARFKYDGSLLPIERGTAIVNGQLADAAIHIFREPPLITFAKQRKQITTIDVKLLQSPVSKTDANLQIEDYLIERISKARNGKGKSCRILLKTLYEHAGIPDKPKTNTEKQQKKRAPEKVKKYLTHYQQEGFITRFTMQPDGVTVYWT